MNGLIVLHKSAGTNSARAVAAVKRLLPRGTKIGHAGTLDPFASGVLVLLVGNATKCCEQVMSWLKTYEATVHLGATTATHDPDSPVQLRDAVPAPLEAVQRALAEFVGEIQQRPPVYSAIKISGQRASDRARRGQQVQIEPRVVHVHSMQLLDYEWPTLELRIECGRGTYIRSIARDLGEKLGVGGYVAALCRTRIGRCTIEKSVTLEQLTPANVTQHLCTMDSIS